MSNSNKPSPLILGIRCDLTDDDLRRDVEDVLAAIQQSHPEDFAWIRHVLVAIAPHPSPGPGDLGECMDANGGTMDDFLASSDQEVFDVQKIVYLVEGAIKPQFARAMVAHELGHVLGTEHQCNRAYDAIVEDEEWASEALADLCAIRWGFETEIRALRKESCRRHHRLGVDDLLPFVSSIDEWRKGDEYFAGG